MATATDLAGFLANDEENLGARLTVWLTTLEPKDVPASIRIGWKPTGMISEEALDEIAIVNTANQAPALIEEVRKKIVEKLGTQPEGGTLRVRISKKAMKASPDVDMSRKLVAGAFDNDGNVAMIRAEADRLRGENSELRRQNVELVKCVTTQSSSGNVLIAEQAKQIASLGTIRAASTSADEWSSLTTVLGAVAFMYFLPIIKQAMGLPTSAGITDILAVGRKMLTGEVAPVAQAIEQKPERRALPPPGAGPDPVVLDPAPKDPEAGKLTTGQMEPKTIEQEIDSLLARFRADQAFRLALGRRMLDPDLQQEFKNAAAEAFASNISSGEAA